MLSALVDVWAGLWHLEASLGFIDGVHSSIKDALGVEEVVDVDSLTLVAHVAGVDDPLELLLIVIARVVFHFHVSFF